MGYITINCNPLIQCGFLGDNSIIEQTLGTRELLTYLEKLEIGLSSFSYEELGVVEAGELKKSFEVFKYGLENKVFGIPEMKQLESIYQSVGIQGSERPLRDTSDTPTELKEFLSLIDAMENTRLSREQQKIAKAMKQVAERLGKGLPISNNLQFIEKELEPGHLAHKINLQPILDDCMGQMELMEELVRLFKQNLMEFIGSVKVHLKNESYKQVDLACQKVRPSLEMMKANGLLEIVKEILMLCRTDNDPKHHAFLYDQFLMEYPKVQEQVDLEMEILRTM